MAANGAPPPVFEFEDDHSYFMVRLTVHAEAAGMHVAMQVQQMLEGLELSDVPREELQRLCGLKNRDHFRKTYLALLLEAGWVERTIPEKPNSRNQRYRMTPAGRDLLGKMKSGNG